MASYLLDVMCARNVFVDMNLSWHVAELPVHVYFNVLWENKYKKSYSLICDEFIARIYFILFKKECPRLSVAAKKMISKVGHWYLDERATYIRVFGATGAPHLLPAHVPDQLVIGEICYQTILQGYNATLVKDKKRGFHTLWFPCRVLLGKGYRSSQTRRVEPTRIQIPNRVIFHKHDPKGLVLQHASQVSSCWSYAHDKFEDEVFTENAQDWDEVVQRMVDPKMTRFKAMSMDEQVKTIEQSLKRPSEPGKKSEQQRPRGAEQGIVYDTRGTGKGISPNGTGT
jgi:hypothetical protein